MYWRAPKRWMTSSIDENMRGKSANGADIRATLTQGSCQNNQEALRSTPVCTLAVYVDSFADWPLVVAANRDEILARAPEPPTLLRADFPRAVGGRDAVAAGT